ncbi:MAG TPA: hypoxanthine phosphoribosyltransferase [Desulfatiglandales bacterium]|nr:hypoxanthine phosphoribosyltransferase [Desulfatiglandales bacterium]
MIIRARVKELAAQISRDYSHREPVILGVLNGAVFFLSDLVREMTIPLKIDFMRAASYGSGMSSSGSVELTKDFKVPIEDKHVILVEDIVDTGLTVTKILKMLKELKPESIKVCALIDKLERRDTDITIDYCGFQVREGFLIGYGLDFNEQYRYLPDIYTVKIIEEPQGGGSE